MVTSNLLQFIAVAFLTSGLLAVVLEIVLRNPSWLWEMVSDVRHFAERPVRRSAERDARSAPTSKSAGSDEPRVSA